MITTVKELMNISKDEKSLLFVSPICQNRGGRFLGLSWRGAGAFPLPDQMVQRRPGPHGEKSELDLKKGRINDDS